MSSINNKRYDALVSNLEAMADGARKHAANVKVSTLVAESDYRKLKSGLETARQDYIEKDAAARMAYDEFFNQFSIAQRAHAGDTRVMKGIMGRSSEVLKDFGLAPEKNNIARKSKPKEA